MAFKLGTMVDMVYMLMLIHMTLTFMQGHRWSGEETFSVESSRHVSKE